MPTFPTVTLLDNFNRANENPINNGTWKKLFGSGTSGSVTTNEWKSEESGEGGSLPIEAANWWISNEFTEPGAAMLTGSETGRPMCLFICLQAPNTEASGYQLHGLVGTTGKFAKFQLVKFVKGVRTVLHETSGLGFEPKVDLIGLSVEAGTVYGWRKKEAGAWEISVEAADATYTKGYVGIGGAGTGVSMDNFEAGPASKEKESEPLTAVLPFTGAVTPLFIAGGKQNVTQMIMG